MKIGLDIHGVIDALPHIFSQLAALLISNGHEVHILTGHAINEKLITELKRLNIQYTHLFSITDYHRQNGTNMSFDHKGNPWMSDDDWDKTKAEYCKREGIDLHIDDSNKYGKYFTTPYAKLSISHEE